MRKQIKYALQRLLEKLCYNWMQQLIDDEFIIVVMLTINGQTVKECKMKWCPTKGVAIQYYDGKTKMVFMVETIVTTENGAVVWADGKLI